MIILRLSPKSKCRVLISIMCCIAITLASSIPDTPAHAVDTAAKKENLVQGVAEMIQEANNLRLAGRYRDAASIWEKLIIIAKRELGASHPDYANSLNALAMLYRNQGMYRKAELLYGQSLAIRKKTLGPLHRDAATTLNNLALVYKKQNRFLMAEKYYLQAIEVYKKTIGDYHQDVATTLTNFGLLYVDQAKYTKAEPLLIKAVEIKEKILGSGHPDVGACLNNLALLYSVQGQYGKAETIYARALKISENTLGADHPDVATGLNNLALQYAYQGQYAKAESLYLRALEISEHALGTSHPEVAVSLGNLANNYENQGEYIKASKLHVRALAILKDTLGPNHLDYATTLNNINSSLIKQGKYQEIEKNNKRVIEVYTKNLGPNHPLVALALTNLANLYSENGRYSESELLLSRALTIRETVLGRQHIDVANSLTSLAAVYREKGQFERAETLLKRALAISQKSLGFIHLDVASILGDFALLYDKQGKYRQSLDFLQRSLALQLAWLTRELPLLPDSKRSDQIYALGNIWELPYGMAMTNKVFGYIAIETRINRHGLIQEIEKRQAQLIRPSAILRNKVLQLQELKQQLTSLAIEPVQRLELRNVHDSLQAELYRKAPDIQIQPVTVTAVANSLPRDSALVEFQRYQPYDNSKPRNRRWAAAQYIALILAPNGTIVSIPLGPASLIDATVNRGLAASAQDVSDSMAIWGQLSTQVLQPLLPFLKSSKQWFISLDGELNRAPFAALPAPQNPQVNLAEAVKLRLITTGRELVRLQEAIPIGGKPLVMANPNYDVSTIAQTDSIPVDVSITQLRSGSNEGKRWTPLAATQEEGQKVASLLSSKLLSGGAANTSALQQQNGPRVLHIATHGFFVADKDSKSSTVMRSVLEDSNQLNAFRHEDPLLRSGLVLAGANMPELDPKDDGYLTASEALNLNLKGTELVVLSACSTGQGEVRTGEGVYGLQRSLTVAGARSTLLSLWKVDDAATADFMIRFYKRLKAGEGRSDALAAVQKEFRAGTAGDGKWKEPYYWAAWQLVGDWRPIPGL